MMHSPKPVWAEPVGSEADPQGQPLYFFSRVTLEKRTTLRQAQGKREGEWAQGERVVGGVA